MLTAFVALWVGVAETGTLLVSLLPDNAGAEVLGVVFAVCMVVFSLPLLRMTTAADNRSAAAVPLTAGEASSS